MVVGEAGWRACGGTGADILPEEGGKKTDSVCEEAIIMVEGRLKAGGGSEMLRVLGSGSRIWFYCFS